MKFSNNEYWRIKNANEGESKSPLKVFKKNPSKEGFFLSSFLILLNSWGMKS